MKSISCEKRLLKLLKITIFSFGPTCEKMGSPYGPCPKQKTHFSEIIKADPKLSKPFYFKKILYVLAELCYECFSVLCNAFFAKVSFPGITAVNKNVAISYYNFSKNLACQFNLRSLIFSSVQFSSNQDKDCVPN